MESYQESAGYFRIVFRNDERDDWQTLFTHDDPREIYLRLKKARKKLQGHRVEAVNPDGWRMIIGKQGRGGSTRYVVVHDCDIFPTSPVGPVAPPRRQ